MCELHQQKLRALTEVRSHSRKEQGFQAEEGRLKVDGEIMQWGGGDSYEGKYLRGIKSVKMHLNQRHVERAANGNLSLSGSRFCYCCFL